MDRVQLEEKLASGSLGTVWSATVGCAEQAVKQIRLVCHLCYVLCRVSAGVLVALSLLASKRHVHSSTVS